MAAPSFGSSRRCSGSAGKPADKNNLVRAACVALVVKHRGKIIICETGIGTKLPEKRAQQMGQWEPDALLECLKRIAVRPSEVDVVLSTHLHWDRAGGFTTRNADGSYAI